MFNAMQNYGSQVLVFDMRSMYDILRSHINYNFKHDHHIPLPFDYVVKNGLSMHDCIDWIPNVLFKDEQLKEHNVISDAKLKTFKARKRMYVFVIASHTQNISSFNLGKLFRPLYAEGVIGTGRLSKVKDYLSLRNAILLTEALKKERVHREVYLVRDG